MNNRLRSLPAFFATAFFLACVAHAGEAETIPAEFQGTWTINKSRIQPSGEQPLRISGREITAHETYGQVVRAVLSGKDNRVCLVTVNASCEGVQGREKLRLMLSPDGRQLTLEQDAANTCAFGSGVYYRVRSSDRVGTGVPLFLSQAQGNPDSSEGLFAVAAHEMSGIFGPV